MVPLSFLLPMEPSFESLGLRGDPHIPFRLSSLACFWTSSQSMESTLLGRLRGLSSEVGTSGNSRPDLHEGEDDGGESEGVCAPALSLAFFGFLALALGLPEPLPEPLGLCGDSAGWLPGGIITIEPQSATQGRRHLLA